MKRTHKYGAVKTVVDGITFPSKREAKRWGELKLLEKAGLIRNLERQVKFALTVNGVNCGNYISDFVYFEGNKRVIEDSKGFATPVYRLKKLLMRAIYGITITEV